MISLLLVPMRKSDMLAKDVQEIIALIGMHLVGRAEVVVVYDSTEFRCVKNNIARSNTNKLYFIDRLAPWIGELELNLEVTRNI